jgi:quercetin dioxygenase-like cupin family protein
MFTKTSHLGFQEKLNGVTLKTLTFGEKTLLSNIKLKRGAVIPPHQHPHEQTGFLLSGCLDFVINGEYFTAGPGDSWTILGNIIHGAEAREDSNVIEVFAPVREDYLP